MERLIVDGGVCFKSIAGFAFIRAHSRTILPMLRMPVRVEEMATSRRRGSGPKARDGWSRRCGSHDTQRQDLLGGVTFKNIIRTHIRSEERPIYLENVEDFGPHRRDGISSMWTGSKAKDGRSRRYGLWSTAERMITECGESLKNIAGFTFIVEEPRAISSMCIMAHSGWICCVLQKFNIL